ncbi:MAG: DUF58 domain-containing protein [Candidatus Eremiobacteraeota bacterium]|nr:DUF58 domain-containing protein [Candidatus Eremiobacteraeota bacterium]
MTRRAPSIWFAARFYWALATIAVLLACSPGVTLFLPLAIAAGAALAALIIADLLRGPSSAAISLQRLVPDHFALRKSVTIEYAVVNRSGAAVRLSVIEAPLRTLSFKGASAAVVVPARRRVSIHRTAVPVARGRDSFTSMYAWYENGLGLLRRRIVVKSQNAFRVYPDLGTVRRYGALHLRNRLIDAGVRRMRLRGGGTEFESLREYAQGDAFRAIDWKATARRGRLMVIQHEVERSQDVMLAIDCGRLMTARAGDRRKLDYAIAAALSLASIASLAHDRVGIAAFAAEMIAARAPRSTAASIAGIADCLSDVEPRFEESDYARLAAYLRSSLRRRSLIVLFTDAIDPIAQSTVLTELGSLAKRHRVLCIFMNDAGVRNALATVPQTIDEAYQIDVAIELARERAEASRILQRAGLEVIDVPAAKLTTAAIDEYLRIKSRGAF